MSPDGWGLGNTTNKSVGTKLCYHVHLSTHLNSCLVAKQLFKMCPSNVYCCPWCEKGHMHQLCHFSLCKMWRGMPDNKAIVKMIITAWSEI